MRKRIAAAAASAAMVGVPAAAHGAISGQGGQEPYDFSPYERQYLETRRDHVNEFGLERAGRNIVVDGYLDGERDVHLAPRAKVVESTERMDAALDPPVPAPTASTATTAATGYSSGTAAPSSTAQCESGGDYGAVNPAGYYGAYQFDQQTWDAYAPAGYHGTNPASAPPAVQDAAAASVPYDAWPSC